VCAGLFVAHQTQGAALRGDEDALATADLHDGRNALGAHAFVLEDPTGALRFEDVRDGRRQAFRRLAPGGENAGHSSSVYWLRFRVDNATASPSFILDATTMTGVVELYDEAGPLRRSGALLPFGERDVACANIAFRIALARGEARTLWLRQQTSDTVLLDPVVWSEPAFWNSRSRDFLVNGLCYGVLIGLAAYNLFLFLATRDRSYLLYVAFQVTNGLTQAALDQYTFQYLWPDHPLWAARSTAALESLSVAVGLAFARAFLDTGRRLPRLDAVLRALGIAGLVLAAIWSLGDPALLGWLGGPGVVDAIILALVTLGSAHALCSVTLIAAAAAVVAARTGETNARVFVVAWAVLLAGTMLAALNTMGSLVSLAGFPLMKLGSAVEAVLLSLALASRINGLRRDRERAQREVLAANTARVEALHQLVSGMAHEVGNPLNFACGGSDELAAQLDAIERGAPAGPGAARRAHRLVASGLARIRAILDNLRRYLSVGDAETVPTDLADEIDQALALAADRLTRAGVRVDRQLGPLPVLPARPGELHQVMLNLIANAIDAMPGGGTLRVAAGAGERELELVIADTGPGVDAAHREKIFEPFFTTRRATGGTGLGLAVAREIVMRHGGSIRVEAEAGGGARFVVALPRPGQGGVR
jgi:signal transduction histidine kinase